MAVPAEKLLPTLPAVRAVVIGRCTPAAQLANRTATTARRRHQLIGSSSIRECRQEQAGSSPTLLNEAEVVEALGAVSDGSSARAVDPASLPLPQQVALMQRTDVLVGASDSGLLGMLFLPANAVVVELLGFSQQSAQQSTDSTWRQLGASLPLHYSQLLERPSPKKPLDKRREAVHVDKRDLIDAVRAGIAKACGHKDGPAIAKALREVERGRAAAARRRRPRAQRAGAPDHLAETSV